MVIPSCNKNLTQAVAMALKKKGFEKWLAEIIGRIGCCCCCCCYVASVMSDSVWPYRWQPTRLPCPWDSQGKNTAVGCHFLLQCVKVKSEREVAQSCLTLSNPMDYSLPGSSVHGIFQARVLEWGAIAFSGIGWGIWNKKVFRKVVASNDWDH